MNRADPGILKGGGVGSSEISFKTRGGGGSNHLLGAICIGNKHNLVKKGGGWVGPDPLDPPPGSAPDENICIGGGGGGGQRLMHG